MKFSKLNNSNFPNVNNLDNYAIENTCDYTKWNDGTVVKLCNVPWKSDYKNVVKFENDKKRDNYFNNLSPQLTYVSELVAGTRIIPDGTVKLEITYDEATKYNYIVVDVPVNNTIKRWFFFVTDVNYSAPNTTQLKLVLDIWTQYINTTTFNNVFLERGHFPLQYSSVDDYLHNPIANCKYLLEPDVKPNSSIVKGNTVFDVNSGDKYICFVTTIDSDSLAALNTTNINYDLPIGTPTFSDTGERWGWQLKVNGLSEVKIDNLKTATGKLEQLSSNAANDYTTYAINSDKVNKSFFEKLKKQAPHFFNTVVACFSIDKRLVDQIKVVNFLGYSFNVVRGTQTKLRNYKLNKDMFKFSPEYERFAKLYTYPYSVLELTDNNGKSIDVKIEDTGTVGVHLFTSLAYPNLTQRITLSGVGGNTSTSFVWKNLNGKSINKTRFNDDWYKYTIDMDIPTYELYIDGETQFILNSPNANINTSINSAITGYHNSVRKANTQYHNAYDEHNYARTNAYASNNAEYDNAVNMANTIKNNQYATDQNNRNVAANTATNMRYNRKLLHDVETYINGENIQANIDIVYNTNEENGRSNQAANDLIKGTTNEENNYSTAISTNNAISSVVSAVGSAVGAGLNGDIGGAVSAGVSGLTNAAVGVANSSAGVNMNSAIAGLQQTYNNTTTAVLANLASETNTTKNNSYLKISGQQISYADTSNENNASLLTTNANITADTQDGNATRLASAQIANATRTRDTNNTIADNIRSVGNNNSSETDSMLVTNAQETILNDVENIKRRYKDAKMNRATAITKATGNTIPDEFQNRAVELRIRTCNDFDVKKCGDTFARYGYTLNQNIEITPAELNCMLHFSYWKMSELWINNPNANDSVINAIESIFNNGVTVWREPRFIGRVNIYDN